MDAYPSPIPWNRLTPWQEANANFKHALYRNAHALDESRDLAHQLKEDLTSAFPLMEHLCQQVCPSCTDRCCQRAWVWVDFKDLLFLHLVGIPQPDRQLLCRQDDHCRYAAVDGCRLDRLQRPFVCSWYLCPAQTRILNKDTAEKQWLSSALQRIKRLRRQMETAFIRAIV